jgi:hypothetical protein
LYPVYVLGEAYLAERKGAEAAAEFQKIFAYRGVVGNDAISSLAHLGLARAYALSGETAKSAPPTRTFSPSGKTPTPKSPS